MVIRFGPCVYGSGGVQWGAGGIGEKRATLKTGGKRLESESEPTFLGSAEI